MKEIDTQAIKEILNRDNTAEVKRNKAGDIIILEVRKKIVGGENNVHKYGKRY